MSAAYQSLVRHNDESGIRKNGLFERILHSAQSA